MDFFGKIRKHQQSAEIFYRVKLKIIFGRKYIAI